MIRRLAVDHPLQLVLGLTLWAVWFVVVYGGMSIACAVAPPSIAAGARNAVNTALLGITMATVALLLAEARRCWHAARALSREPAAERKRFVAASGAALYVWAVAATLIVALPLLVLPTCL
jgi:hypothetical protein